MPSPTTLNVIGGGKVGKTLARLWSRLDLVRVEAIVNRSPASAREAVEFVGQGRAVEHCAEMPKADAVMISTTDEAIEPCCAALAAAGLLGPGVVVFHGSGSLPSTVLGPARSAGAQVASIHPVKSFADPARAVETFAGTYCALEGDPDACDLLRGILKRCGAIPFDVRPDMKTLYHAGTVVVCNYLVALVEAGLRCFEEAGIPRETATRIVRPIVEETVANVFALGPVAALTGPVARGEAAVVARQCEAIGLWNRDMQNLYKTLGRVALDLSRARGRAAAEALEAIESVFRSNG